MNEQLKRHKPREKVELPPRFIRQGLNPYKSLYRNDTRQALELYLYEPVNCIGTFCDVVNKRTVRINLGVVTCRFSFSFQAASSTAVKSEAEKPFEGEDAAPNEIQQFSDEAERTASLFAGAPHSSEKSPGPSVIPGQSLTG